MSAFPGTSAPSRPLEGIRVLDLSSGIAGPLAAMHLADFGADVVKVEPPTGDPDRSRPGFAMWNRNKQSVVLDAGSPEDRARLATLLGAADVLVVNDTDGPFSDLATPETARSGNPGLVVLVLPAFLGEHRWAGGGESAGLAWAASGMCNRQSSFDGTPVDNAFPWVLYLQGAWAAAATMAALIERRTSEHGQVVTVGGLHATMLAYAYIIDPNVPEVPANYGPGGLNPMYTRYQCSDGRWILLATLTSKFARKALEVLGLSDILEDERIAGDLETIRLPANRTWVRRRMEERIRTRPSAEWLEILTAADVPVGPLLLREDWMDSPLLEPIGARLEIEDPERGLVVMPASPVNLVATPAAVTRPAPLLGQDPSAGRWDPRPRPSRPAPEGPATPPLAGIRVLNLGTVLAGPFTGTLLADLGADVIKVEVPSGDDFRHRGMPYIRGQRCVAIDLKSPEGHAAFLRLVETADVVVDNFRAGVLERLDIDYDHLKAVNPDIISVSITGYGEGNAFSAQPAFDPLLQARSGMMIAQGGDSEPVMGIVGINDVESAALAALGTLIALFHRARGGSGQRIWLSLTGTSTYSQCEELIRFEGRRPPGVGGRDFRGPGPTDSFYQTKDGWIRLQGRGEAVAALADAGVLGDPSPAGDGELTERLTTAFAAMTRDEAVDAVTAAGVPIAPARRQAELVDDPEYQAWNVFDTMRTVDGTTIYVPGRYVRFSRSQHQRMLFPPGVGEHSVEILREAGLEEDEVASLLDSGAVRQGEPMAYRTLTAYR